MPMTTPRTVRPERSLLVRTVSKAMTMTSLTRPTRIRGVFMISRGGPYGHPNAAAALGTPPAPRRSLASFFASFTPQCFNWVEPGRAAGRIQAEEQSNERGDANSERDRPQLNCRGNRREPRNRDRDPGTQKRA